MTSFLFWERNNWWFLDTKELCLILQVCDLNPENLRIKEASDFHSAQRALTLYFKSLHTWSTFGHQCYSNFFIHLIFSININIELVKMIFAAMIVEVWYRNNIFHSCRLLPSLHRAFRPLSGQLQNLLLAQCWPRETHLIAHHIGSKMYIFTNTCNWN